MRSGFTLIEVIITTAIIGIITLALGSIFSDIFSYNRTLSNSLTASYEGEQAIRSFSREARSVMQPVTGSYPIVEASSSAITFYTDVNNDGYAEEIRYYIATSTLLKRTVYPTGAPMQYVTSTIPFLPIVQSVIATTTPYFTYYDGSGNILSQPVDPSRIRMIGISLTIERDPNKAPKPLLLETLVTLRNLKDNL